MNKLEMRKCGIDFDGPNDHHTVVSGILWFSEPYFILEQLLYIVKFWVQV